MAKLLVERIRNAASVRPAGYVEEVLALGTVAFVGSTEILTLPDEALQALRNKYKDYPAPPAHIPAPKQSPALAGFVPPERLQGTPAGPGAELKALLAKIGITSTPTCSCNARARAMDEHEAKDPGWCQRNLDTIVGWLREEATKRGLPFLDAAGRLLVRRAIANARRKAAANAKRPPHHDRGEAVAPPVHDAQG